MVKCAPWASNAPNDLGLCVLQSASLEEVYITLFDTVDERLIEQLQADCTKWDTGIEIISVRVVRHRLCVVCSTAFAAKALPFLAVRGTTLPLRCVSTAFTAKTQPLFAVLRPSRRSLTGSGPTSS